MSEAKESKESKMLFFRAEPMLHDRIERYVDHMKTERRTASERGEYVELPSPSRSSALRFLVVKALSESGF